MVYFVMNNFMVQSKTNFDEGKCDIAYFTKAFG